MARRVILTILFSLTFFCLSIEAQQVIRGRVVIKDTGAPVEVATVTLHPVGSNIILTYTMTNVDGTFELKKVSIPDTVIVSVRSMTIETQSKTVPGNTEYLEFVVEEQTTELKEVIVDAPKIRQLGDTIHFDVASFLDETDRSIGDVLKKLPGVQVLSSGEILYQNQLISKFYIEGLDLLQGKYGIASQNINAENVASVQVLENHQPIKALKDMDFPTNAAINLKLKQSALGAFFATAQIGGGVPLFLLSNELVGMRFTQNQQNMLVYKGDNTGRDISEELVTHYESKGTSNINFLNVVSPLPPAINKQHYFFNDAHLGTLNDLRLLKEDLILTTNLSYQYDKNISDSYLRSDVFAGDDQHIIIEEDMNTRLLKRVIEGVATLEGNADNYYLQNKFNLSANWNDIVSVINSYEPITQRLGVPSFHLTNEFKYMIREGDKKLSLGANASYITQNNFLSVTPVLFDNFKDALPPLQQNVNYDHFHSNAYVSGLRQDFGSLGVFYSLGATYNSYTLQSDFFSSANMLPFNGDSLRNNINRHELSLNLSPGISYKLSHDTQANLSIPIRYVFLDRSDNIRDLKRRRRNLLYSPLIIFQSKFNSRISLLSNISFSNNIGGLSEDYLGYIMTSYRTMNRSNDIFNENRTGNGLVILSYRNPFTTLFTTLNLNYSVSWSNTLTDTYYNGIFGSSTSIYHPNTSDSYGVGISFGQSVDAINSEVKLNAGYNSGVGLAKNQDIISELKYNSYYISPSIVTDIGRFMIVNYDFSFRENSNKIGDREMAGIRNFTQNLNTSFIPVKGLILSVGFNHYFNSAIESSTRSSWFSNIGVRYKMKNMDWMLDWTNVFNTSQFVTYSYSDISSYYTEYKLRPSELILRLRFKIL